MILLTYYIEFLEVREDLTTYAVYVPKNPIASDFPARVAELRKAKGFTQQQLAERVGVHVQ